MGSTLGGPIIKNKTFFFVNADWTKFRSGTLEGFGNTTPIAGFRTGDFSALLTGNADRHRRARPADLRGPDLQSRHHAHRQRGSRARPLSGQHHPRQRSAAEPGRRAVRAAHGAARTGPASRTTWPATRRAIRPGSWTRATSWSAWTTPSRPASRGCSAATTTTARRSVTAAGPRAAASPNDPLSDSASNTDYIGEGFTQRIYTQPRPHPVGLDHQQQPDEPLHRGLGPLVHGRRQPLVGRELAGEDVGLPAAERPRPRGRGAAADQLRRQHPLQRARLWLAVLRVREERPLAVLHRPGVGQGPEHRSRWASSTGITSSRTRAGPSGGAAGNFDFNRLGTGGYDAAGNNLSQTGDPFASFLLGQVHAANQSIYAQPTWYENYLSPWINAEFKVNSKLTLTRGCAWTTRPPAPRRTTSTPRSMRTRPTPAPAAGPGP